MYRVAAPRELDDPPPSELVYDTASLRLVDLLDVTLDIETIDGVTDGHGAIPALRFIQPKLGPKVDTAPDDERDGPTGASAASGDP